MMEIETHKMNRVAYKGKYLAWRTAAIVMASAWLFTMGVLAYVVNRYYVPVIAPIEMEVGK